jgi:ADP-ribosylglycohydrolase
MENSKLFKKVYGCMLGGAIGDALGGPVEHTPTEEVREKYGNLDHYIPYNAPPAHHWHFYDRLGAYTDDTRLKHLFCKAIFNAGGKPRVGDLNHVMAEAYHNAPDDLHEGFLEEYYMQCVWGQDKVPYGGEPTNGAIMANSPLGLITACQPDDAYQLGFDLAFFTVGHAKSAAAIMVTAIAEAMRPEPTVDGVIAAATEAHHRFNRRRNGDLWHNTEWRYDANITFLEKALEIARKERDVFAIREPLREVLEWGHLFSDSIHTLVVALSMFVAAEGDAKQAIVGSVMYGRDKDSYASVVGALAGAFHGADAFPKEWIEPVIDANPDVDMHDYALRLTKLIVANQKRAKTSLDDIEALI